MSSAAESAIIEGPAQEGPVPAVHRWGSNAHLIADVARLGYLEGHVVDVTYGKHAGFWKVWQPERFTAHDLNHLDGVDFTDLPEPDDFFDALVIDGPYKLNGTDTDEMAVRFGVERSATPQERHDLISAGIREAGRVVKLGGHLLVKCQDQINSGRFWAQTKIFTDAAEDAGFVQVDRFDLIGHARPQPMEGREQEHAHGRGSTLLVFIKARDLRQGVLDLEATS